jgi:hypothetical protein
MKYKIRFAVVGLSAFLMLTTNSCKSTSNSDFTWVRKAKAPTTDSAIDALWADFKVAEADQLLARTPDSAKITNVKCKKYRFDSDSVQTTECFGYLVTRTPGECTARAIAEVALAAMVERAPNFFMQLNCSNGATARANWNMSDHSPYLFEVWSGFAGCIEDPQKKQNPCPGRYLINWKPE